MARTPQAVTDAQLRVDGGWWLVHALPLFTPLIGCAVYSLPVWGARAAFGGDPVVTPILSIVLFAAGGAITWFWTATCGPRIYMRVLAVVTGGLGTLMLVLVMVLGWPRMWIVYVTSSLVVWAMWVIWRGQKYAGATASTDANPLAVAVASARTQFSRVKVDGRGVVTARVDSLPGGTLDDTRALVPVLAADVRAVPGTAHLSPDPDHDGVGVIEVATRDNLKGGVPWTGVADTLGQYPTAAFTVGEYQSGPCRLQVVGDIRRDLSARDLSQLKIAGVTGSGKSTGAQGVLAKLMAMRRVNIIGIDLSAELQILGPIQEGLTVPPITDAEAGRLFMARISHVVTGRKAQLAREGLKRWSLDSVLNLLVVWAEESKELARYTKQYVQLVSDARAAGIWVVSSTQSWLYRQVSTDVRKQTPSAICFGMTEPDDVASILPPGVLLALGRSGLPTWGDTRPGYAIVAGAGAPERLWAKQMRFENPTREQLVEAVRLGAPYRDPMDPVTRELFGELFQAQARLAARPAVPQRYVYDFDREDGDPEAAADEQNAQDHEELRRRLMRSRQENLGDDAEMHDLDDVDPEQEIDLNVPDDGEEDDERPRPSPEEAQRIWDDRLDERYRSGARTLTAENVAAWLVQVGRERTFFYRQRDRWQAAGCIQPGAEAGTWDLVASPYEQART